MNGIHASRRRSQAGRNKAVTRAETAGCDLPIGKGMIVPAKTGLTAFDFSADGPD